MAEGNILLSDMTCITVAEDALGGPMHTNVQFMGGMFTIEQCSIITPAETRVFILAAVGLTALKTEKILSITSKTVGVHRSAVYEKLRAENLPHAIDRAYELGILVTEQPVPLDEDAITSTELNTLALVAKGLSQVAIGKKNLGISPKTVNSRLSRLRERHELPNVGSTVLWGHLSGLLPFKINSGVNR